MLPPQPICARNFLFRLFYQRPIQDGSVMQAP
jgi:hypothetical protein